MKELDRVVLCHDSADAALAAGDMGTIVHAYADRKAYEVEFVSLTGDTIAVVTLPAEAVRAVAADEVPHARKFAPRAA